MLCRFNVGLKSDGLKTIVAVLQYYTRVHAFHHSMRPLGCGPGHLRTVVDGPEDTGAVALLRLAAKRFLVTSVSFYQSNMT
jgi:hypothetical protein